MPNITLTDSTRNSTGDHIVDKLDAGPAAGYILLRDGGVTIVEITCNDPAWGNFGAVNPGEGLLNVAGMSAASVASGDIDNFKAFDSDDNEVFGGTAGGAGSGAVIIVDNPSVVAPQVVTITSGKLIVPAN